MLSFHKLHHAAANEHQGAIAQRGQFVKVGGHDDDSGAPVRRLANKVVDVGACTDIDALRGFVYLSLGSLGCMDNGLVQRIIDLLDRSGHRATVSLGPLHES